MLTTTAMVLAKLRWDPTVRGILFPLIMFVILCGSSYAIMATNVGNRLGFLIAAAGLSGWMMLLSGAWMIYGIGPKGRAPAWKVQEVLVGDSLKDAQQDRVRTLADGFQPGTDKLHLVKEGNKQRGDAQAVVDAYLKGHKFFKDATEYAPLKENFDFGGDNQLFTLHKHKFYLRSSPHYFVSQVQAVETKLVDNPLVVQSRCVAPTEKGALPATPEGVACRVTEIVKDSSGNAKLDKTKPVHTIVLLRDRGSIRQPPFVVFIFSGILTGLICWVLHRRDKQVMAEMGQLARA